MSRLRFSNSARVDLKTIAAYTLQAWGREQACKYIDVIQACCKSLCENPGLGQAADEIRPGLRRKVCGKHIVFYRSGKLGILVIRILHERMQPADRFLEER